MKVVLVFWGGNPHEIVARRKPPSAEETSLTWTARSLPRITESAWRATYGTFRMDRLSVGEHTVELTVDGQPGGTYKFSIQ